MAVQNTENGVVRGTQGHATIRQSAYDFLFDFNSVSILYRFRDIPVAGYLSKVADFDPPHLPSAPLWGATPFEFRGDLWRQKTRVPGWCCFCDPVFSRFSRTPTCDRRTDTDRRTQAHG